MKKYKKKAIKEKDQVSETEEVPDGKVQQTLLPDYIGTESEGGDYVNHTAEEVDPVQRDIAQQSAPVGLLGDFPVEVDWSQMAVDKRKKRLYGGRTRTRIKNQYNFVNNLLFSTYVCLNCHKLLKYNTERCPYCNSLTTALFNKKNPKKTKHQRVKYNAFTNELIEMGSYYVYETPRAFEYMRELSTQPLLQLEEVPGTRLKGSGKKLPGISAHKDVIDKLRKPFAGWLNRRIGWHDNDWINQTVFVYVANKPQYTTIYDKTYTVVTNYLERLKLIRLQLWYELYHSLGGLGDFKQIKSVTIDKKKYIKLYVPEAEGYYSYSAHHVASDKTVLILSPEPDPELDSVENIQPIQIGRSEKVKARMNLSMKNSLYSGFKEAYHALIFKKDELIIVIPQEKSFIFPFTINDIENWRIHSAIDHGESLDEKNPSGPTRMYIEWDKDDFYDDL